MAEKTSDTNNEPPARSVAWREAIGVVVLAIALTVVFWKPLWTGGGVIGGDSYSYFLPQKQFFAERLHQGELPLWNNRAGFGYPLVAESQTGVFYPPHLILYPALEVNSAYSAVQLLHYVLAFVFTWLLARELGLRPLGAILASLIFVYGWFAPRMCWEWAIIGATWMPAYLWCVERFLKTSQWRYLSGLSVAIGIHLLAGHFNLAFIALVLLVMFAGLRLLFWREQLAVRVEARRLQTMALVLGFVAIGFGISAAQLLPTWELKQLSQRQGISDGPDFDPAYGHIPPLYLSQIVASWWFWYSPDINLNQALNQLTTLAYPAATNHTEAHLYFGLMPLFLIGAVLLSPDRRRQLLSRFSAVWLAISVTGIVYAVGWLMPIGQHLPGFSFFRGPGRWGILAALGVGLIAGQAAGVFAGGQPRSRRLLVCSAIFLLTAADLWYVSRVVSVVALLERAPMENVESSPVRQILDEYPRTPRLYGPGPNLLNLLGHSSVPEYLGIGPAEYYDPELEAPPFESFTPEFLSWAERAGITHVLSFHDPRDENWNSAVRLVWDQPDPFLNPSWARGFHESIYLTEIIHSRGRVSFAQPAQGQQIKLTSQLANSATIEVVTPEPATVVMTDLIYPGWQVTVDGESAEGYRFDGQFRAVDVSPGKHTVVWSYHPASVRIGMWISVASICALLAIGHIRFWHFSPKPSSGNPNELLSSGTTRDCQKGID